MKILINSVLCSVASNSIVDILSIYTDQCQLESNFKCKHQTHAGHYE